MAKYDFTANTISCAGRTFPAKYASTGSGAIIAIVTMPDKDKPARVKYTRSDENYAAALEALKEHNAAMRAAEKVAPAPVEAEQPAEPAPVEQPAEERPEIISSPVEAAPVEIEQPPPVEEEIRATVEITPRAIPEKTFIGETITGKGWRILFDGDTQRTRVCFDAAQPFRLMMGRAAPGPKRANKARRG